MIISRLIGGLGNQMFQYAAGRALALRNDVPFYIDRRAFSDYKTHAFGLDCFCSELMDAPKHYLPNPAKEGKAQKVLRKLFAKSLNVYIENGFTFNSRILKLPDDTYLDGYWQSEKYFYDFAETIRTDFTVRHAPSITNKDWLERINNTNSISLHIRRGDYITNPSAAAVHGSCDLTYYHRAVAYICSIIKSEPTIYIFSDDPDWVATHLQLPCESYLIRDNDASTNYEDLRLMATCQHHIIANSSFSWWGAWLGETTSTITIAPIRWFATDTLDTSDLIPSRWIRL